jgi:hypothetical protein
MFAWAIAERAPAVLKAMRSEFSKRSIEIDEWIVEINSAGARVVSSS